MSDWHIRPMELSDVPSAIVVGKQSYGDEIVPLFNSNIESDLMDTFSNAAKRPRYFVALREHEIIGFAGWCRTYLTWKVAVFSYCHILPGWQGRGLGRALTNIRLDDIRGREPEITTVLVNTWATHIYARYGFKSVAFDDDLLDEGHLMRLKMVP